MTDNSRSADETADSVAAEMKALGFRKRGRLFNRTTDGGVVHVAQLNLQPALSRNEGSASFMFGVAVPRMVPDRNFGAFVPEYLSQLRLTQTRSEGTKFPGDYLAGKMRRPGLLRRELFEIGLPWLDSFPDERSVLAAWEKGGFGFTDSYGCDRFELLTLYVARGDRDGAEHLAAAIASHPLHRQDHERVVGALVAVGAADRVAALPPPLNDGEWAQYLQTIS